MGLFALWADPFLLGDCLFGEVEALQMVPSGLASARFALYHALVMLLALTDACVFGLFELLSYDDFCDLFTS